MFLKLNHQNPDVYSSASLFVKECCKITATFPSEEKFALVSQIRRAALSVHLNIAEGASRRSDVERKRYFEIARGSVIEIDAALDIASDLNHLVNYDTSMIEQALVKCFKILPGLVK